MKDRLGRVVSVTLTLSDFIPTNGLFTLMFVTEVSALKFIGKIEKNKKIKSL